MKQEHSALTNTWLTLAGDPLPEVKRSDFPHPVDVVTKHYNPKDDAFELRRWPNCIWDYNARAFQNERGDSLSSTGGRPVFYMIVELPTV